MHDVLAPLGGGAHQQHLPDLMNWVGAVVLLTAASAEGEHEGRRARVEELNLE